MTGEVIPYAQLFVILNKAELATISVNTETELELGSVWTRPQDFPFMLLLHLTDC